MRPSSLCLNSLQEVVGLPRCVPTRPKGRSRQEVFLSRYRYPPPFFGDLIYDFGLLVLSPSRVNDYIDTGLADDLVDPDKGANVERKMQSVAAETSSSRSGTAETIPPKPAADSPGWTGFLTNLPPVSYGQSIWNHFAERPIVEAVDGVRNSPDHDVVPSGQSEPKTAAEQSEAVASAAAEGSEEATDESEVLSSFLGLCKGYKFFADKHVQAKIVNLLNLLAY